MRSHRRLEVAGAALGVLTFATSAFAQDAAETTQTFDTLGRILTVEGDADCDQFALGSEITELEEDDPGPDFSLEGPDGQEVTAAIPDGVNLEWQATVPVNFVIARGRGDVLNVYVFGNDPALFDRGETAM
jgi:hypothetical protein